MKIHHHIFKYRYLYLIFFIISILNLIIQFYNHQSLAMIEQEYDSYGFRRRKHSLQTEFELSGSQHENQKLIKWQSLDSSINLNKIEKQREIVNLVREGIPDELRPEIWPRLFTKPIKEYKHYYQVYKNQPELKQINLDLDRTMPDNKKFAAKREQLKNVLNAIAVALPQMGYCQGLNFIVANLLLVLNEEKAFNAIYHILYWQRHEQLMTNLSNIHRKLYCLSKLIKKHYPKLYKTLQKCESQPLIFTSSWFITLFNNILPYSYAFRILECYFIEGQKILYRVALQIFKEKKKMIKMLEKEEQIIEEMTKFSDFNASMIDRFFTEMFQLQIARKQIETWENQFTQKEK